MKNEKEVSKTRRRFLKSAAKVAIYTPPAMLIAAQPSHAKFSKSGGRHPFFRRRPGWKKRGG